jgi:hypothetical protein
MLVVLFNSMNAQKGGLTGTVDGFQPDSMLDASITPLSPIVGWKSATVQIMFKPKNPLKSNGKVFVFFEYWNLNT